MLVEKYVKDGYFVLDLERPELAYKAHEELEQELSRLLGKPCSLERYHEIAEDNAFHTDIQNKMTQFFRAKRFAVDIIKSQVDSFKEILGPDISVQVNPYLRIARPGKTQDNLGYHRDTHYGGTAYELSIFIPYVDLVKESALGVIPGTHIDAESKYPLKEVKVEPNLTKGSVKHQLGFLYAPKAMEPHIADLIQPVPLRLGQVLGFCLSTVHGAVVNGGENTRWSSDIRILNTYAPVEIGTRTPMFEAISKSPVAACSHQYMEANGEHELVQQTVTLASR